MTLVREARNAAVRAARDDGHTGTAIAATIGKSDSYVGRITKG